MDCVIKIVKGPGEGEEFHCATGETVVGRSPRSHVRLVSPTVSFEHAVIMRLGDNFFVENLSASGTFVNDERISGRVRLRAKDRLRLGQETVVRVEAVPAGGGDAGRRRLLIVAVVVMVAALIAVVVLDPMGQKSSSGNWRGVYAELDAFVHQEVAIGRLPVEAEEHFEKAWRLRESGDAAGASDEWLRLRILLAGAEEKTGYQAAADANRHALADLFHPPKDAPVPNADQLAAGLVQFVEQMTPKK
jgi:pSer/pThr/pTyr-binding forkhead associated (FHA) protein